MDPFISPAYTPFLVAILVMLVIGTAEGLSLLLGGGLSHHVDSFLAAHFAHPPDVDTGEGVLGWLHIGRAPILVLLVVFLTGFAIVGLLLQWSTTSLIGHPVPTLIASGIAAACAVVLVRGVGGAIARAVPKDETSAVSEESFIGRVARLTAESAAAGRPGQAKLTDEHGRTHYLLVEPDRPDVAFARGEALLVVSRASGSVFRAIHNPRPDLL
jgi:hypothetical protein